MEKYVKAVLNNTNSKCCIGNYELEEYDIMQEFFEDLRPILNEQSYYSLGFLDSLNQQVLKKRLEKIRKKEVYDEMFLITRISKESLKEIFRKNGIKL